MRALVATALLVGMVSSASAGVKVSQSDYGDKWPFTVESGEVECLSGKAVVFKTGGKTYALNGAAKSRKYPAINTIWRDNPSIPGAKVSLGGMINLGLNQCK